MSNLSDLPFLSRRDPQLLQGRVQEVTDAGWIAVRADSIAAAVHCRVLQPGSCAAPLAEGDEVLVWLNGTEAGAGVVLGRIGVQADAGPTVVPADAFAARAHSLILETQGDLVLRTGHARIKLGAQGDVEIVCTSFVTRCQRLLRLLAPFIKLN